MSLPPQVLATKTEIEAIFRRADESIDRLHERDDDGPYDAERERERSDRVRDAVDALRFCATAASAMGDVSLLPLVIDVIDRLAVFEPSVADDRTATADALARLLSGGLAADKRLRALAGDADARYRAAIARGLPVLGDAERKVLEALAADPEVDVRKAAKKSLASVTELPWWTGKWKSDPAARLLPTEMEASGPALALAGEILDLPRYELFRKDGRLADLLRAFGELPDVLVVEAIELFLCKIDRSALYHGTPLLQLCLTREGGVSAFVRLIAGWGGEDDTFMLPVRLTEVVRSAPPPIRLELCERLMAAAASAPFAERGDFRSAARLAAAIVGAAWPPDGDVNVLLETLLSLAAETAGSRDTDHVRSELDDAFRLPDVDPAPILERLVEARLAGYPGAWERIESACDAMIERAPAAVLRRVAEQAIASDDDSTVTWGLGQLLGASFDAAADGDRLGRAATFLAEPRLRRLIVADSDLSRRSLGALRAELRAGKLSGAECVETFTTIDALWGGLVDLTPAMLGEVPDEEDRAKARKVEEKNVRDLGPWICAPELQGPPTAEEWRIFRRAAFSWDSPEAVDTGAWARTLSAGPWTQDERAELDSLVTMLRAGTLKNRFMLAIALAAKPDSDLLPLFDELYATAHDKQRKPVRQYRATARKALGLPPSPGEAERAAEGDDDLPGGKWDEDDE